MDRERGGEIAGNLIELYYYMQRRLLEANIQQTDNPLAEVDKLLRTVLEGWQSCVRAPQVPYHETETSSFQARSF